MLGRDQLVHTASSIVKFDSSMKNGYALVNTLISLACFVVILQPTTWTDDTAAVIIGRELNDDLK